MKHIYLALTFLFFTIFSFAQIPPNDEIQNAVNISSLPFTDNNVQTQNATTASGGGMNGCDLSATLSRVYYRYQYPITRTVRIKLTESSSNSIIAVYSSNTINATSDSQLQMSSACNFTSDLTIDLFAFQAYYIAVSNPDSSTNVLIAPIVTSIVNIPDTNFKTTLVNHTNPVIDANNDNEIQYSEAFFAEKINANYNDISDLTGVQAFVNLEELTVSGNNLSVLDVSQNILLEKLFASNNQLSSIDLTQNIELFELNISGNAFPNIDITQNSNITFLNCNYNQLTAIDISNNENIEELRIDGNELTILDVSQNTMLETLYCQYNQITELDLSNNPNLIDVASQYNEIVTIDVSQCENLEWLHLPGNNLTTINLNNNPHLVDLSLHNNPLTIIDLSQNLELFWLGLSDTLLQDLDLSNNSNLVYLVARGCEFLETINFKNNYNTVFDVTEPVSYITNSGRDYQVIPVFNATNNPNLQTICVDDVTYATQKITNITPNTVFVEDCSINNINYNNIQGIVAFDDENNGCDINDFIVANQLIQANDGVNNIATFTNNIGDYNLYLNENTYNTEVLGLASNFYVTPNPYNTTFTGFGNSENADFCISSSHTINDVNVVLLPLNQARPSFDANYQLVFENTGTTLLNGTITLNFDDASQTFVNAIPTENTSTSNSLTFNYSNLQPFQIRTIDIVMNTFPPTTVNDGDILNFTATINPIAGDNNTEDNTFVLSQTVVNSYDPNDKQVLQGNEITLPQATAYLDYIIRFQNTGSASAINIVITDELNSKLDWETIRPISASHDYSVNILNGNFVEFSFENINLPAQQDDEAGSNGFVAFKIKPKQDVVVGNIITGKANIYFDYNAPIITNVVSTEIVEPLSIPENEIKSVIKLYPNPVGDQFKIEVTNSNSIIDVKIFDVSGKQLLTFKPSENYNVKDLVSGVYFVSVQTNDGTVTKKIIK
ncbi:DUF7619 domain-containing protein [Lacinutrix himadriensis]|uniref:DUF7619 domain-containing protein n=1 Tax=Lacinutrix himadriensis TaxID=641549 RepID=UPI0006E2BE03|nr:T9SS type A sorting domain-containing protein [Lacinutrix himadriensis]